VLENPQPNVAWNLHINSWQGTLSRLSEHMTVVPTVIDRRSLVRWRFYVRKCITTNLGAGCRHVQQLSRQHSYTEFVFFLLHANVTQYYHTYETCSFHDSPYYLYCLLGTTPYGNCENYRRSELLAVFYFRIEARKRQHALSNRLFRVI